MKTMSDRKDLPSGITPSDENVAALHGRPETKGEYLVGISFNPGKHPTVDKVKRQAAALIDTINELRVGESETSVRQQQQIERCVSLAIDHVETAAMFAVKAATKLA